MQKPLIQGNETENNPSSVDLQYLKSRVTATRARAIENLDKLLAEFEANFTKRGAEVWWIDTAETFASKIKDFPSSNWNFYSGGGILPEEFGIQSSPQPVPGLKDLSIETAEFYIAETAQIIVRGAAPLKPGANVRLILASIERAIPSIKDAGETIALLSEYPAWQGGSLFHIVSHEASNRDERVILAIVDNGRHQYFESPGLRQMMRCIGCGACAVACPLVDHQKAASLEPEPLNWIGKAISHKDHGEALKSTLCGACTTVCPVGIPIHELFIEARENLKQDALIEKQHWVVYRSAIMSRRLMNQGSGIKQFMLNRALKKFGKANHWNFAKESFNEQWKKRN